MNNVTSVAAEPATKPKVIPMNNIPHPSLAPAVPNHRAKSVNLSDPAVPE